ncbi:unnamed protein product [Darwinula stevensoni]|uniref:C2H2-type domain-containing protein n=1 Tax=Darwinula stevensoni TaxID=69355 RepID=A0A7R8XB79_9CRUS|nr:unnamed protein product [Darwinula stevensoni]CAG0892094.1 unnamed protein product [Darwinula stevensoni]
MDREGDLSEDDNNYDDVENGDDMDSHDMAYEPKDFSCKDTSSNDSGVPIFKCDLCEYESYSQGMLQTHLKCHENDPRKPFQCDICNMKFSNGANMRRHRVRHTGVKPYACKICQKRFFRKDHLAEHMTTHNKKVPFHCPICNKGFQRQIAMRAHFQNEHVGHQDGQKSCGLCGYSASSLKGLGVHMAKRHGIDLDNPIPSAHSESALLQSLQQYPRSLIESQSMGLVPSHFLAPQVEISVENSPKDGNMDDDGEDSRNAEDSSPQQGGNSPHSDSNSSNAPTSTNNEKVVVDSDIQPDISLIPIKQEGEKSGSSETEGENNSGDKDDKGDEERSRSSTPDHHDHDDHDAHRDSRHDGQQMHSKGHNPNVSLIKVSPLKTLLREDPRPLLHHARIPPSFQSSQLGYHKLRHQCFYCGIIFPDQTLYFLHKGFHSENNPWKCNICGEQSSNIYEFNSHLLSKAHQ